MPSVSWNSSISAPCTGPAVRRPRPAPSSGRPTAARRRVSRSSNPTAEVATRRASNSSTARDDQRARTSAPARCAVPGRACRGGGGCRSRGAGAPPPRASEDVDRREGLRRTPSTASRARRSVQTSSTSASTSVTRWRPGRCPPRCPSVRWTWRANPWMVMIVAASNSASAVRSRSARDRRVGPAQRPRTRRRPGSSSPCDDVRGTAASRHAHGPATLRWRRG